MKTSPFVAASVALLFESASIAVARGQAGLVEWNVGAFLDFQSNPGMVDGDALSPNQFLVGASALGPGLEVKIIGGFPSLLPEIARIRFLNANGGAALCSGVAVAADRVLTAGHCGCGITNSYEVELPRSAQSENEVIDPRFFPKRRLVRPPLLFPRYDCRNPDRPQPGRDLALLFLDAPASEELAWPPPVAPMFLVRGDDKLAGLLIAGYGRTENADFPRGLRAAWAAVRDFFCVNGRVGGSPCASFREFVLSNLSSRARPAEDTCDGDSGGPVYWIGSTPRGDSAAETHRFLVGITSRSLLGVPQFGPTGCGGGGVYTTIGHVDVLGWLNLNGAPLEVGLEARHFAEIETLGLSLQ